MWFDSHFHLNALADNWQPKTVAGGLVVAVDEQDWRPTRNQLRRFVGDWRQAIGFHPWIAQHDLPWQQLALWLSEDNRLAVGEIGLDGSSRRRENELAQWDAFVRQVALARDYNRVMSLHLVHDGERGYQFIHQQKRCQGIVHGFSGSLQQALRWQALGFYIGIGGRFLSQLTDKRRSVLQGLDKSLVLLETDAPYHRIDGQLGTPESVVELGAALAKVWVMSVEDVERLCQKNWLALWSGS